MYFLSGCGESDGVCGGCCVSGESIGAIDCAETGGLEAVANGG
jgi:hypothetical protein